MEKKNSLYWTGCALAFGMAWALVFAGEIPMNTIWQSLSVGILCMIIAVGSWATIGFVGFCVLLEIGLYLEKIVTLMQ